MVRQSIDARLEVIFPYLFSFGNTFCVDCIRLFSLTTLRRREEHRAQDKDVTGMKK